jgi:hypothetical protein
MVAKAEDAKNVSRDFAKSLVTTTKLALLKTLPTQAVTVNSPEPATAPASAEQVEVDISSGDVEGSQRALNDQAAKGFRLVQRTSSGNRTAALTLEKSADPAQTYAYVVLRAMLASNLEKGLNKAAGEGYRYVPHTSGWLAGYSLIAEKTAAGSGKHYQYRVHVTSTVEGAEKNIKEDQAQGFLLIDTSEILNEAHLVVTEKASH